MSCDLRCLAVPTAQVAQSDFVAMLMTSYGGHLAWIDGVMPVSVGNFMDRAYGQYVLSYSRSIYWITGLLLNCSAGCV